MASEIPDERTYAVLKREQDDLAWCPTTKWGGPVGVPWDALERDAAVEAAPEIPAHLRDYRTCVLYRVETTHPAAF
jgi:hypothetical protein